MLNWVSPFHKVCWLEWFHCNFLSDGRVYSEKIGNSLRRVSFLFVAALFPLNIHGRCASVRLHIRILWAVSGIVQLRRSSWVIANSIMRPSSCVFSLSHIDNLSLILIFSRAGCLWNRRLVLLWECPCLIVLTNLAFFASKVSIMSGLSTVKRVVVVVTGWDIQRTSGNVVFSWLISKVLLTLRNYQWTHISVLSVSAQLKGSSNSTSSIPL